MSTSVCTLSTLVKFFIEGDVAQWLGHQICSWWYITACQNLVLFIF